MPKNKNKKKIKQPPQKPLRSGLNDCRKLLKEASLQKTFNFPKFGKINEKKEELEFKDDVVVESGPPITVYNQKYKPNQPEPSVIDCDSVLVSPPPPKPEEQKNVDQLIEQHSDFIEPSPNAPYPGLSKKALTAKCDEFDPDERTNYKQFIIGLYGCYARDCKETFNNYWDLKLHRDRKHDMKHFMCHVEQCIHRISFDTKKELRAHCKAEHQNTLKCICRQCDETVHDAMTLGFHYHQKHYPIRAHCADPDCTVISKNRFEARKHFAAEHPRPSEPDQRKPVVKQWTCLSRYCPECLDICNSESELGSHMKTEHDRHIHLCVKCHFSWATKEALFQHAAKCHPGEKQWRCAECEEMGKPNPRLYTFKTVQHLTFHEYNFHAEGKYACEFQGCMAHFNTPFEVKRHFRIEHSAKKKCLTESAETAESN